MASNTASARDIRDSAKLGITLQTGDEPIVNELGLPGGLINTYHTQHRSCTTRGIMSMQLKQYRLAENKASSCWYQTGGHPEAGRERLLRLQGVHALSVRTWGLAAPVMLMRYAIG